MTGCAACDNGLSAHVPYDGVCHHRHPQVLLTAPNGQTVNVDEGVAAFVQRLWDAGFATFSSCQGTPGEPGGFGFVTVDPKGWR